MKNSLYDSLVKLAFENPEIREDLMPVLKEHDARFEKGKPADPTENMSPEDAEKWEEMKEEHGDKFKDKDADSSRASNLRGRDLEEGMRVRHKNHPEWGVWRVEEEPPYDGSHWAAWSEDRGRGHSKALSNPNEWEKVSHRSAQTRVARSLFRELVDYREMMRFRSEVQKHDEQAAALLKDILLRFHEEFELDPNVEKAYNRLQNMVGRGMGDPSSARNQIAKIANLLGMDTPLLF